MRAIVIERHGGPEVLRVSEHPAPTPGTGELLVDVAAAGVNFRDVYERVGAAGYGGPLPIAAGVEGAGRVAALGDGVDGFVLGDRVAWVAAPGSYAEQVVVKASRAVPVPEGVDDETAGAALLQGITAQYLSTSTYPVRPGDTIVADASGVVVVPAEKLSEVALLLRQYDDKETRMIPIIKETRSMLKALERYGRY